jgi:hypothetical protein
MSDAEKAYQSTPASTLEEQIMNPCIAKNEREWWAAAEIELLRAALEKIEYLDRPQVRGLPRRVSIQEIATAALAEEKPNDR